MTTVTKTVYATWEGGKESEGKDGPGSHRYVSLELILRYKRTRLTLCIEYSYWQYKEINLEMGWLQEWWCGWGLGGGARDWVRGGAASMGGMCPQLSPLERYTGAGPHLLTPGEGWLYKILSPIIPGESSSRVFLNVSSKHKWSSTIRLNNFHWFENICECF